MTLCLQSIRSTTKLYPLLIKGQKEIWTPIKRFAIFYITFMLSSHKNYMKKNTHPIKNSTTVILHNGSSYIKKWIFFKKVLKLDNDFLKNKLWDTLKKK